MEALREKQQNFGNKNNYWWKQELEVLFEDNKSRIKDG